MLLTYLLLLSALIAHLFFDLHKQKIKHPIIHWLSASIVLTISCAAGLVNSLLFPEHVWWSFVIYSLCIHLALFDLLWNEVHGESLFYSGTPDNPDRAWTDRLWERVPPMGQVLFRIWFLLFGSGWYYHLNLILG